jgi:hypothetical protein
LNAFVARAPRPPHFIRFEFRRDGGNVRKNVATAIRGLFLTPIAQAFGGFIERLEHDGNAMEGLYRVTIWTPAESPDDGRLEPLWRYVTGVLGVDGGTILMEQDEPADRRYLRRMYIAHTHAEEEEHGDWSDVANADDLDSVISIASIHY